MTITIHDIPHAASGPAARALRHALELRLTEWNQRPAAYGIPGV